MALLGRLLTAGGLALLWGGVLLFGIMSPDWVVDGLQARGWLPDLKAKEVEAALLTAGAWTALALFVASLCLAPRLTSAYGTLNSSLLWFCKVLAVVCLAIMVGLILVQIFWRYVLDSPLSWTEEAARFGMLWMTGLMAPLAFRMGGFVSIDMLEGALPRRLSAVLTLILFSLSLAVLAMAAYYGWNNHIDTLTGRGKMSALRIPETLGIVAQDVWAPLRPLAWLANGVIEPLLPSDAIRFKNQWAFASLWVGAVLMTLVCIELILKQLVTVVYGGEKDDAPPAGQIAGAA